jgi:hypothetical protein
MIRKVTDAARWFAARPLAVYATIFAIYLIARVITVAGGEVFQSWDSAVYAYRDDPTRNRGPLLSFIGHAPRPWGLPLFFAMFPTDEWRAIGQSVLGAFAWTVLAWELTRHLKTRPAKYAAFASVLLFSALTNVTAWDFTILTESTTVSVGVLVVALLMRWARTDSWVPLAVATALTVWWTFIRPDIRVFTVVVIGLLLVAGWRIWRRRGAETAAKPRLLAIGASVLVLGLGIAWYSAITPSMDKAFAPYDGDAIRSDPLPADEELYVYRLRVDVSTNPEMWQAYKTKLGLPTCPEVEAFTHRSDWASVEWAQAYRRCQPMVDWVAQHKGGIFWTDILKADPGLAIRRFLITSSLAIGGEVYAHVPQVVPAPIEKIAFPSRRYGLPLALLGYGAALALALAAGARRYRIPLITSGVLMGAALLSIVATVVVHSGEYARFGVQETLATRVAMIILLACALDAWILRRRTRATAPSSPAVAVDDLQPSRG